MTMLVRQNTFLERGFSDIISINARSNQQIPDLKVCLYVHNIFDSHKIAFKYSFA